MILSDLSVTRPVLAAVMSLLLVAFGLLSFGGYLGIVGAADERRALDGRGGAQVLARVGIGGHELRHLPPGAGASGVALAISALFLLTRTVQKSGDFDQLQDIILAIIGGVTPFVRMETLADDAAAPENAAAGRPPIVSMMEAGKNNALGDLLTGWLLPETGSETRGLPVAVTASGGWSPAGGDWLAESWRRLGWVSVPGGSGEGPAKDELRPGAMIAGVMVDGDAVLAHAGDDVLAAGVGATLNASARNQRELRLPRPDRRRRHQRRDRPQPGLRRRGLQGP